MTVLIGLYAQPFMDAAFDSAEQVLRPDAYIAAVARASEAAELGTNFEGEAIPTLVEPIDAQVTPPEGAEAGR